MHVLERTKGHATPLKTQIHCTRKVFFMLKMIDLPYPLNALEPYYSKETLDLHYNILYKGYVDNTNNVEEKLRLARENKDFSNIKCLEKDLSFFGSGAILHELFFQNMGPAIPTEPDIELMKQIIKDFGSYEIFKEQFTEASKTVEASRLGDSGMGSIMEQIRNITM